MYLWVGIGHYAQRDAGKVLDRSKLNVTSCSKGRVICLPSSKD